MQDQCKPTLGCLESRVVSRSDSKSGGLGSTPGGAESNLFFFLFYFFLLELNKLFSFFSSFQSRMMDKNKSEKL